MYFVDNVQETTAKSGAITNGSTMTILGAVPPAQAFSTQVPIGDPCMFRVNDGGAGLIWFVAEGTLSASGTLTVDTLLDGSSGVGAGVTLTTGTHQVFLIVAADALNKMPRFADFFIDYVQSGLLLPSSSGSLTASISAGVAFAIGQRVKKGAQAHTYTASRDTYVDLSNVGTLTYVAVTNGAGAPALTANSIRLGYVVSGSSTITSAVTSGKDSLGNSMRNILRLPVCSLAIAYNAGISAPPGATVVAFNSSSYELIDNHGMHSVGTNPERVTAIEGGWYDVKTTVQFGNGGGGVDTASIYYAQVNKGLSGDAHGTLIEGTQISQRALVSDFPGSFSAWSGYLGPGDYIECAGYNGHVSASQNIIRANLYVTRLF